ncbi:DNA topoisomerase family protein [Thorsellia anophelis]|uniref:Putative DNA topoisomerase n=1 Tax=Thorsellia anophelis DSM 18579 TaxID=1123402 RepID=A0A1H9YRQ1_9GAMM|nr:topoisomerase DNA-binding C4 zinc finger domain-containing protein [Thorsellia anophelis]SES71777.1 putative DNA topoisomerase [Thorsellia anophelis DSM 18579]
MSSDESKPIKGLFKLEEHSECPLCGAKLVIKSSSKGPFLGCSNYPECHHIQSFKPQSETTVIKELPEKHCELCQSPLVLRQGRYGMFISCVNYPSCHYAISTHNTNDSQKTHSLEQNESIECPSCQEGHLISRQSRFGKRFWGCSTYPTCKFIVNLQPIAKSCPKCQLPILLEKRNTKGVIYQCASKKCDFHSDIQTEP